MDAACQAAFDICKGKEGFLTAFTNVTAIYDALDQWLDQAYHWRRASPDDRLHNANMYDLRFYWRARCANCAAVVYIDFDGVWRVYGTAANARSHLHARTAHRVTRPTREKPPAGTADYELRPGDSHEFCHVLECHSAYRPPAAAAAR